jgi:hypothetical protein
MWVHEQAENRTAVGSVDLPTINDVRPFRIEELRCTRRPEGVRREKPVQALGGGLSLHSAMYELDAAGSSSLRSA